MPVSALESLAQERAQRALDEALGSELPLLQRLSAVQRLQTLATPPVAAGDAEDALHCVLTTACEDEVCELAEAALWAVWLASGDELVDATMRQGLKLMGAGELAKATRAFTEVVAYAPSFAEGWNKRATALFLAERFDESIEDCCRVLELKPRHFGCLSGLGICHLRKGNEQTAERWLRRALEVNPRCGDVQRIVENLEVRSASSLLRMRTKEVLDAIETGAPPSVSTAVPSAASAQVQADWDVYRVQDMEMSTYYFRVRIACLDGPPVSCVARYYVLQQGSSVLPLSRVTPGNRGFTLRPGQTYKYSFMLTMAKGLSAVQGGLLLRSEEDTVESGLQHVQLQAAERVRERNLGSLNQGYHFMGRLQIEE